MNKKVQQSSINQSEIEDHEENDGIDENEDQEENDDQNEDHDKNENQGESQSCTSYSQARSTKSKKKRKRLDPASEKRMQNYECYKEYCRLKTIHDLIKRELKVIKTDNEVYEDRLEIMKENRARHEDELGYYLDIEDSKNKRIRRLATEIERKHRCLVVKCPKAYGSEGSLNQHLIRKHKLVYEEWINRITEIEKINQKVTKEDKDKIRKDIEKISMTL